MEFFKELSGYLLGNASAAYVIAAVFYVLLGAAFHILYDVQTRYKRNLNSPLLFSWNFFYTKNKYRFILNISVAVLVPVLYSVFVGNPLPMKICFALGLVFDSMCVAVKKASNRINEIFKSAMDKYLPKSTSVKTKL